MSIAAINNKTLQFFILAFSLKLTFGWGPFIKCPLLSFKNVYKALKKITHAPIQKYTTTLKTKTTYLLLNKIIFKHKSQ